MASCRVELDQAPGTLEAVRQGLKDSVSYGMAHLAAVPGIEIAGKTGTASDAGESWSHGWFAGTGDIRHKEVVIVILSSARQWKFMPRAWHSSSFLPPGMQ